MKRRELPPPEAFTVRDGIQIAFGLVMIPLGITILFDVISRNVFGPGLLVGVAFLAFGLWRTIFAWGRVRWYLERKGANHG